MSKYVSPTLEIIPLTLLVTPNISAGGGTVLPPIDSNSTDTSGSAGGLLIVG